MCLSFVIKGILLTYLNGRCATDKFIQYGQYVFYPGGLGVPPPTPKIKSSHKPAGYGLNEAINAIDLISRSQWGQVIGMERYIVPATTDFVCCSNRQFVDSMGDAPPPCTKAFEATVK